MSLEGLEYVAPRPPEGPPTRLVYDSAIRPLPYDHRDSIGLRLWRWIWKDRRRGTDSTGAR